MRGPHDVSLRLERTGGDLLCRIQGGASHVGAVTIARWDGRRAATRALELAGHRESDLAMHAAHRLCAAARTTVVCIARVHFEGLASPEIDAILRRIDDKVRGAARDLESRRRSRALGRGTLCSRIATGARRRLPEVVRFLDAPMEALLATSRDAIDSEKRRRADRVVIYAPLYLSDACLNDCTYCGFRRGIRVRRTKLTVEAAVAEAALLEGRGHRTIDLVAGEIPTDRFVSYVADVVKAILGATAIRTVNLNLGALDASQLALLAGAGAAGYNIYQETYGRAVYAAVHGSGPKSDMAFRLATAHRAADAGFRNVGLGVLLGLAPVREEIAALAAHAGLLRRAFPALGLGFSLPRLRDVPRGSSFVAPSPVDDETLAKSILYLRTHFGDADISLTTRERPDVRDALLPLGVTRVSAGVSTAPGGYSAPGKAGQFTIGDARSLPQMEDAVRDAGYDPVRA